MALKIERILPGIFQVQKPDKVAEKSEHTDDQPKQNQQQNQEQQEEPVDRQKLEKAVEELRGTPSFAGTGMRVEMVSTKNGLQVHLTQATGMRVKTMTASEFMKLREESDGEEVVRGKILDQKF